MGRLLGCDYGRVRIGISHSDERKLFASPLKVFKKQKRLESTFADIKAVTLSLSPFEGVVVGLPLLLNGQEGEMAKEAKIFGQKLALYLNIPCIFWDERLSSSQADRLLREDNLSRKERSAFSDTLAATLILQNYLDFISIRKPT